VAACLRAASYWLTWGLVSQPIEPAMSTKQSIPENLRILFLLAAPKNKQTVCLPKSRVISA
jgi:hypothetical protein